MSEISIFNDTPETDLVASDTPFNLFSQPSSVVPAAPKVPDFREFGDTAKTKQFIFDDTLAALKLTLPTVGKRHTLQLVDPHYIDPDQFTKKQRKEAILQGRTLGRRIRGTWQLLDNASGKLLDSQERIVARVPYMTSSGTFIHNGVDYILNHQQRLLPGVYARQKANGEVESHFNITPGRGVSHRYFLDPEKQTFQLRVGQANLPLFPLLKTLGATDKQIQEAWGPEIFAVNSLKLGNNAAMKKIRERILRAQDLEGLDEETANIKLKQAFESMPLNPEVTKRTLGQPLEKVDANSILLATRKLLDINAGRAKVDDRDHLAYQTFYGPEDLFAERVLKDHSNIRRNLLRKAAFRGNLQHIPNGALTPQLEQAILGSGLGQALEEVNALEILDKQTKVTRLGEGSIPSVQSIPAEARNVQSSHLGFLDPVRTPESMRLGVDLFLARNSRKGRDGRLYGKFRDLKTGEDVWKSPQDLADATIAFPRAMRSNAKRVFVMKDGGITTAERDKVDYELQNFESSFSPLGNLVALKSAAKGQRFSMASRMLTQALSLTNPEAPLVQSAIKTDKGEESFNDLYAKNVGAVRAKSGGVVEYVDGDEMRVRYDDGKKETISLYNNMPLNRKSAIHNTAKVAKGDRFAPNQLLAKSNFTDDNGQVALGLNARVAYLPFRGLNFEDAIVISESMAKRFTSEGMYQHQIDKRPGTSFDKKDYIANFGDRFDRKTLDKLDDNGLIKPGTEVKYGDPLALAVDPVEYSKNKIHRKGQTGFSDKSVTWEHSSPGIVTDAVMTKNGPLVVVKSTSSMKVGDKMCYDPLTRVLTKAKGWISVAEVTTEDEIFTLNPKTEFGEWQKPTHVWEYQHDGLMYSLVTKQLDMLVTPDHRLWAAKEGTGRKDRGVLGKYHAVTAEELYKSRAVWKFKKDCKWAGQQLDTYVFPEHPRKYRDTTEVLRSVPANDWLEFLGYYISEGWAQDGAYVKIGQFRTSPYWEKIDACLTRLGLTYRYEEKEGRFEIGNAWLAEHLAPLGDSYTKYVPEFIQELPPSQIWVFFEAYMNGDGHWGNGWEFSSSSYKLMEGLRLLCLKLGYATSIRDVTRDDNWSKNRHWRARINRGQLRPLRSKKLIRKGASLAEGMVPYSGKVYCVTVPNHILYVERNGKSNWSMNSGLYGDKGIVSGIIPDDQMPHGPDGRPVEVLANPNGIISRGNPAQMIEAALGRVARKTGKPVLYQDFEDIEDMRAFAEEQLRKHGLEPLQTYTDPQTGKRIEKVFAGDRFFMKLHHMSEDKLSGRGSGGYSSDDTPSRGGPTGCFTGETLIRTYGGRNTIKEIVEGVQRRLVDSWPGEKPGIVTDWFHYRVPASSLVTIELENGEKLNVTKAHNFVLVDGTMKAAGELTEEDELLDYVQEKA